MLRSRAFTVLLAVLCLYPASLPAWILQKLDSSQLADGLTVIILSFSDHVAKTDWKSSRLENPPRLLLRLKDCRTANIPQRYLINDGTIGKIRLGYHPEVTPPELYVVLTAATGPIRIGRIVASGQQLLIYVCRAEASSRTLAAGRPSPTPKQTPIPKPAPLPQPTMTPEPLPTPKPIPTQTPVPTPHPPPIPQPTPTVLPTPIPIPTVRPTPIPTPTPLPRPTRTPKPVPTPTPSPQPTATAPPTPLPVPPAPPTPVPTPIPPPLPTPAPTRPPTPSPIPPPVPTPIPTSIPTPPPTPIPPEPKPKKSSMPEPPPRTKTIPQSTVGPKNPSQNGESSIPRDTLSPNQSSLSPPREAVKQSGPKILDFAISQRPEGQTIVRISTDSDVEVGTFGLQYKLKPSPTEILSILNASLAAVQPSVGEADPNLGGIRIQHREGPAGPSLDIVFGLKAPDIRVLQTAQQDRNLVLVFGK